MCIRDRIPPSARDRDKEDGGFFSKAKTMFSGDAAPPESPRATEPYRRRYPSTQEDGDEDEEAPSLCSRIWGFAMALVSVVTFTIVHSVIRVQGLNFLDVLLVRSVILVPLVLGLLWCRGISLMPENSEGMVVPRVVGMVAKCLI